MNLMPSKNPHQTSEAEGQAVPCGAASWLRLG